MPDEDKLRRMVDAGYTQAGIAALLGVDIGHARRLVRALRKTDERLNPKPRQRPSDFHLRDVPLSDAYVLRIGDPDQYLERLYRMHPEKAP